MRTDNSFCRHRAPQKKLFSSILRRKKTRPNKSGRAKYGFKILLSSGLYRRYGNFTRSGAFALRRLYCRWRIALRPKEYSIDIIIACTSTKCKRFMHIFPNAVKILTLHFTPLKMKFKNDSVVPQMPLLENPQSERENLCDITRMSYRAYRNIQRNDTAFFIWLRSLCALDFRFRYATLEMTIKLNFNTSYSPKLPASTSARSEILSEIRRCTFARLPQTYPL